MPAQEFRPKASIEIGGEVPRPQRIDADVIRKLRRVTVRGTDHGKPSASYSGVTLASVLELAGLTLSPALRGPRMATYLVVGAQDGYRAVFALPELDSAFTERQIILADSVDGRPLAAADGPYRIVVAHEKRSARWVRQVTSLTIVSSPQ